MNRWRTGSRATMVAALSLAAAVAALLFWPHHVPLGDGPLALVLDIVGNVAVFALLAGLGVLAFGRPVLVVGLAALLSGAAELAQATFLPDRYPSLLDIAANVSGAILGVAIVARLRRRRARQG